MTLKEAFRTVLYTEMDKADIPADLDGFDFETIWAWIEDKLDKARIEGEVGKYELSIKLARIKAIDDVRRLVDNWQEQLLKLKENK